MLPRKQGAHASHQQAVLRDKRDRPRAGIQAGDHLGRGALRLGFEVVADRFARLDVHGNVREGIIERHVGIEQQPGRGAGVEQRVRERVQPARLDDDPRRGRQSEQQIGGRRRRHRGPLEGHAGEPALHAARPGRKPQHLAALPEPRLARGGDHGGCGPRECMRGLHHGRHRVVEAARIASQPGLPGGLRTQQASRRQPVQGGIETHLPGLRRRRWRKTSGQCLRRLDARHPSRQPRKGTSRKRQVLRERHQHDRVAQRHALPLCPSRGLLGQALPGVAKLDFKGEACYRSHRETAVDARALRAAGSAHNVSSLCMAVRDGLFQVSKDKPHEQ